MTWNKFYIYYVGLLLWNILYVHDGIYSNENLQFPMRYGIIRQEIDYRTNYSKMALNAPRFVRNSFFENLGMSETTAWGVRRSPDASWSPYTNFCSDPSLSEITIVTSIKDQCTYSDTSYKGNTNTICKIMANDTGWNPKSRDNHNWKRNWGARISNQF